MTGRSFTDPPSVLSYVSGGSLEAALHIESCVLAHKEAVPGKGCEDKSPTRGRLGQEGIPLYVYLE